MTLKVQVAKGRVQGVEIKGAGRGKTGIGGY